MVEVHEIEDGVGYNALPMRALNEHLYDRAFWEALRKHGTGRMLAAWLAPFTDHIEFALRPLLRRSHHAAKHYHRRVKDRVAGYGGCNHEGS